jgi:hypothetical protein
MARRGSNMRWYVGGTLREFEWFFSPDRHDST